MRILHPTHCPTPSRAAAESPPGHGTWPWRLAGALLSLALGAGACAAPPQRNDQVPGFFRETVGHVQVTALYDGVIPLERQVLKGMDDAKVQAMLARMFQSTDKVQTAVNGYLVHTGRQLVLIDAGAARCFGPGLGQIPASLKAAGYTPADVDAVLLTHMHPDHMCGIADAEGKALFPNATVWAAQADADFWLSQEVAAKAPKGNQVFFQAAREAAAPYQAAGRLRLFKAGDTLVPGISVMPTPGHTPGHTSYLVDTGATPLLIWGDIVHFHAVQFVHPEVSMEFDTDQPQAVQSRKAILAKAADAAWWVGGAHLPFPGLGHIRPEASGYTWVPVEYGPVQPATP